MEYNKAFFEKVFSTKRMERYFRLLQDVLKVCRYIVGCDTPKDSEQFVLMKKRVCVKKIMTTP